MAKVGSMTASTAFGVGAGYVAISPKFWVFTLGAIAAIADSDLPPTLAIVTFVAFVALALSVNLAMIGFSAFSPSRSADLLQRFSDWLERNNRIIKIVLGTVFGTWFLFKALSGFGLI
jgi:threonine/homoserine/homoserine lactone efflux protein